MLMSRSAFSDSRWRSCAQIRLAIVSSIGVPRKMMCSLSNGCTGRRPARLGWWTPPPSGRGSCAPRPRAGRSHRSSRFLVRSLGDLGGRGVVAGVGAVDVLVVFSGELELAPFDGRPVGVDHLDTLQEPVERLSLLDVRAYR